MNNEIKEKIKAYYIGNDIDKVLDYITNLQEEKDDYKSRIDKTIEFIEKELIFYITIGGTDERKLIGYNKAFDELLKILKGDSSN